MTDLIRRALISVSNKAGLIPLAQNLVASGVEIIATDGTAILLKQQGIPLITITDYTGFPEIMGGRVKTLHSKIYAGLLRRPGLDETVLEHHQIKPIDLVIVNLYPFEQTISQPTCRFEQAIEQIDIGGVSIIRAAAKNHAAVTVVVDPEDYAAVLRDIQKQGQINLNTRRWLAKKAFAHTARYDQAIYDYLNQQDTETTAVFPELYQPIFQKKMDLRYGENPHQPAALYTETPAVSGTLANAELLQGKPLSYNNLLDSDAALNCILALDPHQASCAIIKHATPCGVAQASTLHQAYQQALTADPTSAFGGIIAVNQPLDAKTAQVILNQQFVEVIIAPSIQAEALQILKAKPLWRVLSYGLQSKISVQAPLLLRSISGGLLVQQADHDSLDLNHLTIVTQRQPTQTEQTDLLFAWKVVQFVKSNAIVYAKNQTTVGIGGGQTSRVFSAEIAALKAQQLQLSLHGAVAASDAFFPFTDGLEVIAKAGITAIIQPGGSKRDEEVIDAANRHGIAMVFTNLRHFRH